jgi:hypothetical protein
LHLSSRIPQHITADLQQMTGCWQSLGDGVGPMFPALYGLSNRGKSCQTSVVAARPTTRKPAPPHWVYGDPFFSMMTKFFTRDIVHFHIQKIES